MSTPPPEYGWRIPGLTYGRRLSVLIGAYLATGGLLIGMSDWMFPWLLGDSGLAVEPHALTPWLTLALGAFAVHRAARPVPGDGSAIVVGRVGPVSVPGRSGDAAAGGEGGNLGRSDGRGAEPAAIPDTEPEALAGTAPASADRRSEPRARWFEAVMRGTSDGVVITDTGGRILDVNPAFTRITGFERDEVLGRTPSFLKSGRHEDAFYRQLCRTVRTQGEWRGAVTNRHKAGHYFTEYLSVLAVPGGDEGEGVLVGMLHAAADVGHTEAELRRLAYQDPVTGLPNRNLFQDRLDHALRRARREPCLAAVLYIDIDRFKAVNDSLGHATGDVLLGQVAARLAGCLREVDTLARQGGDELIVLVDCLNGPADVAVVAHKLLRAVAPPFTVEGHELYVTVSIGISLFPDNGEDADSLVRNADAAMYRAKERGRNRCEFYTEEMTDRALERLRLETGLRRALDRNELFLEYQPQVALADEGLTAVEALVRWRHPQLGVLGPERFVAIAEETHLIGALSDWVLRAAAHDLLALDRAGVRVPRVAVKLGAGQLREKGLVERVRDILAESGLGCDRLELEVGEDGLVPLQESTLRTLSRLRALGIRLSIDDFGTGASSLAALGSLPVDRLKIDRTFMRGIPGDREHGAVCTAVVALGRSLGLGVIAEGVDTRGQKRFLAAIGCEEGQGLLFGKPLCAEDLAEWLSRAEDGRDADGQVRPRRKPAK